jgi:hypothetical protein
LFVGSTWDLLFLVCPLVVRAVYAADVILLQDKDEWMALVESFDTIDFTGFPAGTLITTQYASRGLVFTDRHDFARSDKCDYPNDGEGLFGGFDQRLDVHIHFRAAQFSFAIEHRYCNAVLLYRDGELVFESPCLDGFIGLLSDEPFDEVHVVGGAVGKVHIDDLHFGPPICVADLDGDETVGFGDLVLILSAWGDTGRPEDLDANGIVDFDDLLLVLDAWGPCK